MAILNQDKVVSKNACCKFSFLLSSRFVSTSSIPMKIVIADDKKVLFLSSYKNCTKKGISINTPNVISSTPIAKNSFVVIHF